MMNVKINGTVKTHTLWIPMLLLFLVITGASAADSDRAVPDGQLGTILCEFEPYALKAMKDWESPGMAIAIVKGENIVYAKGFGTKRYGSDEPVDEKTVFQIGSISKSFTACLLARLVDEKKAAWRDRVVQHYPLFMMYDPWVTREFMVEDLMAQHSGMTPHAGDLLALLGFDRASIIDSLRSIRPVTSFRSSYAYVNNLWLVAAAIDEKYSGMPWEQSVKEHLFLPLSLTSTSTGECGLFGAENHAVPHSMWKGKMVPLEKDSPADKWVYTFGPAGGINSNVLDMSRYAMMHLHCGKFHGRQVIQESSMAYMHYPRTIIGGPLPKEEHPTLLSLFPASYCLGWVKMQAGAHSLIWHNGGTSGCRSILGFVPDSDIAFVMLSNTGSGDLPEALMFRFFDMYFGSSTRDYSSLFLSNSREALKKRMAAFSINPEAAPSNTPLIAYTGRYTHKVYGPVEIRAKGQELSAGIGPGKIAMGLKKRCGDVFEVSLPDFHFEAVQAGFARFRLDEKGTYDSVVFDLFSDIDEGLFTKIH